MYKTKPCHSCEMPKKAPVEVLVLNASLKHRPEISNTEELAELVLENMKQHGIEVSPGWDSPCRRSAPPTGWASSASLPARTARSA